MSDSSQLRHISALDALKGSVEHPTHGLRKYLQSLGQLSIVGSYPLGLILPDKREPDVDMNLLVDIAPSDLVRFTADAGIDIVSHPQRPWHKFEVYDNRKACRPNMPPFVYLGMKAYIGSQKVAADVWFFNDGNAYDAANENHAYIAENLTDSDREVVLRIKAECAEVGIVLPSYTIYRSVIEEGVTSLSDIQSLSDETITRLNAHRLVD